MNIIILEWKILIILHFVKKLVVFRNWMIALLFFGFGLRVMMISRFSKMLKFVFHEFNIILIILITTLKINTITIHILYYNIIT